MDDVHCRLYLASLLYKSSRDAVLQNQPGLDEVKTMATELFVENEIHQRHDSRALLMQLEYAEILYNHGSLDEAARIRQRVLYEMQQLTEPEDPWKLVMALRSYAESLMASGDTTEPSALLKEALDICETSLKPENMSCAGRPTDEHLDASSSSGANCLPATEKGGRVVEGTQSTLADRSHKRDHKSRSHSLWNIVSAPARYLCGRISHMKPEPRG